MAVSQSHIVVLIVVGHVFFYILSHNDIVWTRVVVSKKRNNVCREPFGYCETGFKIRSPLHGQEWFLDVWSAVAVAREARTDVGYAVSTILL